MPNRSLGPGTRPALVVVDATIGFTSAASPLGCESSAELAAIARLLAAFRERALPVFYTVNAYAHPAEASVFRAKIPLLDLLAVESPLASIAPERPYPQQARFRVAREAERRHGLQLAQEPALKRFDASDTLPTIQDST